MNTVEFGSSPEEAGARIKEAVRKRNELYASDRASDEEFMNLHEQEIAPFLEKIKARYGNPRNRDADYSQYKLWHVLVDGEINIDCPRYDFPGEYSVEKFIDELYEKRQKEKGESRQENI